MKKIFLICCLAALSNAFNAQVAFITNIKKVLHEKYPELEIDNKLIAVNFWSVSDNESRENNKAFNKTCKVYHSAKLKGGPEGMLVLAINHNNLDPEATIAFHHDGVTTLLSIGANEIQAAHSATINNIVFDMYGREVYKNMHASQVYQQIQKLITR